MERDRQLGDEEAEVTYYNENDPFKAEWLRQLIARNAIATGLVDERSIEDVKPSDLDGYVQCHFFAGIGIWSYALRLVGWPDERKVWTGSCPCQPFSVAGKQKGALDERHLWPAWFRLISECRPGVVFGEQVADGDGITWLDAVQTDMESAGYRFGPLVLPAAGCGATHGRHRIMFVADTKNSGIRSFNGQSKQGARQKEPIGGHGISGQLADSTGRRPDRGGAGQTDADQRKEQELERLCNVGVAQGDAKQARLEGHGRNGADGHESERLRAQPIRPTGTAGPANGHWSNALWLTCSDGKFRPVEPVPLSLADGLADSLGRVRDSSGQSYFHPLQSKAPAKNLRLTGYGDGIVAPVAAQFIKAYLEIEIR